MHNGINTDIFSLGEEVYIVGGYLRDLLMGKKAKDIDYIVRGDIKKFANRIFDTIGLKPATGTLIELKKEQMIRIVLKKGLTLDFTELKGDIEDNLGERDFTMNAIAWSPQTGLIDPCNGLRDIKKRIIRTISIDNFKADPLRLLRVYRFVAELEWDVDSKTRRIVRQLNKDIKRSASERITQEFFKLLNSSNYENALKIALKDGLLESFLSITHKKLTNNIQTLSVLESRLKKVPLRLKINLEQPFSQELTLKGLFRLEQVLNGSILSKDRLRLSRLILERLKTVHKLLKASEKNDLFSETKIFDTFFEAKDAIFDLLILTGNIKFLDDAERFKNIWKKSFLTAEEIMDITGLRGGVELGRLIYRLKKTQFKGKLKTKKDAMKWLKTSYM